jgi:hypothetical protein
VALRDGASRLVGALLDVGWITELDAAETAARW